MSSWPKLYSTTVTYISISNYRCTYIVLVLATTLEVNYYSELLNFFTHSTCIGHILCVTYSSRAKSQFLSWSPQTLIVVKLQWLGWWYNEGTQPHVTIGSGGNLSTKQCMFFSGRDNRCWGLARVALMWDARWPDSLIFQENSTFSVLRTYFKK